MDMNVGGGVGGDGVSWCGEMRCDVVCYDVVGWVVRRWDG